MTSSTTREIAGSNFWVCTDPVDTSLFELRFAPSAYGHALVRSLVKARILPGAVTNEYCNVVRFKAHSVKPLKTFQQERTSCVYHVAKLIRSMSKQLAYMLEHESCTILGLHPDHVLVINDEVFVYAHTEWVTAYDRDTSMAMVSSPFTSDDFFVSPELQAVRELPAYVHYKTGYFSFGCLLLSLILGEGQGPARVDGPHLDVLLARHPIKDTRIFWLLSRCLVQDPAQRSIILL